ncbi:MAG: hypothetical protein GF355_02000 [Candidatus Eisenbacteria bacterium]|nr:hypothetical protein [Candidatus Eisenbacteria bacterium]
MMPDGTLSMNGLADIIDPIDGVDRFRIDVVEEKTLTAPDEVRSALAAAAAQIRDGWLSATSQVIEVKDGRIGELPDVPLLDGEFTLGIGESLHLRHLGESRWRLSRLKRVDAAGCGTRRRFFRAGDPKTCLIYEISWMIVPDAFGEPALRPHRARFAGFARHKES